MTATAAPVLPVSPAVLRAAVVSAVADALRENRDRGDRSASMAIAEAALDAAGRMLAHAPDARGAAEALRRAADAF